MTDKENSSLEIAKSVPSKASDNFWEFGKSGPIVSLKVAKQTAMTIADSDEEEAPAPKKEGSLPKMERKGH